MYLSPIRKEAAPESIWLYLVLKKHLYSGPLQLLHAKNLHVKELTIEYAPADCVRVYEWIKYYQNNSLTKLKTYSQILNINYYHIVN